MFRPSLLPLFAATLLAACAARDKELKAPLMPHSHVAGPEFPQAAGHLLDAPLLPGNRLVTLLNGDQIFPEMLSAIRGAKRTITFETFVFEEGTIPRQFAEALAERAKAGVKVHMLVDAHGGRKSKPYQQMLRDAGVELELYHPFRPWSIRRYNNRTHRKLLVVDGSVGFIGGVGIADQWAGSAQSPKNWRDNHYRLEGPAVAQMQAAFNDNWIKVRSELLHGPDYFPPLPPRGSVPASVFFSSPRRGRIHLEMLYHLAISSARRSILIENAYFVPDSETVDALVAAARRGVRVQVLVPGPYIDHKATQRASRRRYGKLMDAGIEIYEFQPTMLHAKLLIVDGMFTSVGSGNFDYRSLQLNDEANLNVYDTAFAARQARLFEQDRARARRVTPEEVRREAPAQGVLGIIEEPFSSLL